MEDISGYILGFIIGLCILGIKDKTLNIMSILLIFVSILGIILTKGVV